MEPYSILKSTLTLKHKVNIEHYAKIRALLKINSECNKQRNQRHLLEMIYIIF